MPKKALRFVLTSNMNKEMPHAWEKQKKQRRKTRDTSHRIHFHNKDTMRYINSSKYLLVKKKKKKVYKIPFIKIT